MIVHTDWKPSFQYLIRVTESIFSLKKQNLEKIYEDVAFKVSHTVFEPNEKAKSKGLLFSRNNDL